MDPMSIMLVPNCSQIFEMFPAWKNHPCQFWALEPGLGAFGRKPKRTNKPTNQPAGTIREAKEADPHPTKPNFMHTMFPEQIHRFASSLIPPNNGYIVVKVDGDRHSQVRWRFVFGAMIKQYMGVAPFSLLVVRLMVQKSQTTTVWMVLKPLVNNGISTTATSTGERPDFWTINSMIAWSLEIFDSGVSLWSFRRCLSVRLAQPLLGGWRRRMWILKPHPIWSGFQK